MRINPETNLCQVLQDIFALLFGEIVEPAVDGFKHDILDPRAAICIVWVVERLENGVWKFVNSLSEKMI